MAKGMGDILYLYRMWPATRAGVEKHLLDSIYLGPVNRHPGGRRKACAREMVLPGPASL